MTGRELIEMAVTAALVAVACVLDLAGANAVVRFAAAAVALHRGLTGVVKAALIGSVLANGLLVLGIAFFTGGVRHGVQTFHSSRARTIATLTLLAAATLSIPSF